MRTPYAAPDNVREWAVIIARTEVKRLWTSLSKAQIEARAEPLARVIILIAEDRMNTGWASPGWPPDYLCNMALDTLRGRVGDLRVYLRGQMKHDASHWVQGRQ